MRSDGCAGSQGLPFGRCACAPRTLVVIVLLSRHQPVGHRGNLYIVHHLFGRYGRRSFLERAVRCSQAFWVRGFHFVDLCSGISHGAGLPT
jgi:hypothetical protein